VLPCNHYQELNGRRLSRVCRYCLNTMHINIYINQSHSTWSMLNTAESSKTLALLAEGFTEALVTAMMVKYRGWRCCKTLAICCALARMSHQDHGSRRRIRVRKRRSGAKSVAIATV
jgi:hypothetical protein